MSGLIAGGRHSNDASGARDIMNQREREERIRKRNDILIYGAAILVLFVLLALILPRL